MTIDEQVLKRVRDLAALGHTPSQIASLLDIPIDGRDAFVDEFSRPNTQIYAAYYKGRNMMDYNTNVELARAAEKGDVEAIELMSKRKEEQKYNEALAEMWGV